MVVTLVNQITKSQGILNNYFYHLEWKQATRSFQEEFSDEEFEVQEETIAEAEGEVLKLPLVPKSEPAEPTPPPASE